MAERTLSLLAQYDDMCRRSQSVAPDEKDYQKLLVKCEYVRLKWLDATQQLSKANQQIDQLEKANKELEQKWMHLRAIYMNEASKKSEIETEVKKLRHIIDVIRSFLKYKDSDDSDISSLSMLNTDELINHISSNSKLFGKMSENDELEFDKTEDSIKISNAGFNLNEDQESPQTDQFEDTSRTYVVNSVKQNFYNYQEQRSADSPVSSANTVNSYSEDETNSNGTTSISTANTNSIGCGSDVNQTPFKQQFYTPNASSSPMLLPKSQLKSCASVKSKPRVKVDLGLLNNRPHNLQLKKAFKPMFCVPCGKSIGFCSKHYVCIDCRTISHSYCQEKMSLPCIPHHTPRGLTRSGSHTHMLIVADFVSLTSRPFVPPLLVHCCNEIDRRSLGEVGIYRKCGSDREIRELKTKFLHSKTGPPNISKVDVHVLCGVVKQFLRDLDDPLLTRVLWHDFVRATDSINSDKTEELLKRAIEQLPDANRDTLSFLMLHLQRVVKNQANRMSISALGRIFGPAILGYSVQNPSGDQMLQENARQFQVIESLLGLPSTYWDETIQNPRTPQRVGQNPLRSTRANSVMSPYSYRSACSSVYGTPTTNANVTRYTPKRNKLAFDQLY